MKEKTYKYSPNESEDVDAIIIESYDKLVQLERRNLLVVSFIVFFSALSNINPTKGALLGFTFDKFSEKHFYITLIALIIYFLSAYLVYGYPKFKSTIKSKKESKKQAMTITSNVNWWHLEWPRIRIDLKYWVWLSFHYLLPIVMAIIAIFTGIMKIV